MHHGGNVHKSHSIDIDGMDLATLQYANVEKGLLNCIQFAIKSLQLNGEKRAFFSGFFLELKMD